MTQVKTTFTSDDRDVQKTLQKMHSEMVKLREQNRKLSQESKRGAQATKKGFKTATEAVGNTKAAIVGGVAVAATFVRTLTAGTEKLRQMRTEAAKTQFAVDKITRGLQIQGGLNQLQTAEVRGRVFKAANRAAVGFDFAASAQQQLVSSGFIAPDKSGALEAFLLTLASSNASPTTARASTDPRQLAQASGQFLAAFGKQKTGKNLLELGVRTRGLFKGTDVQLSDLSEFAKAAPEFAGAGVSLEDTLSVLAALRETRAPGEAATQARNVASILQSASTKKKQVAALSRAGLRPEDVDLEGETFVEALSRLSQGTRGLGQAERAAVLTQLFGRENKGGAQVLLENVGRLQELSRMQRDDVGFEKGVVVATSGINAAKVRLENDKMKAELDKKHKAAKEELIELGIQVENAAIVGGLEARGKKGKAAFFAAAQATFQDAPLKMGLVDPSDVASAGVRRRVEGAMESDFSLFDLRREVEGGERAVMGAKNAQGGLRIEQQLNEQNELLREANDIARQNGRAGRAAGSVNRHDE